MKFYMFKQILIWAEGSPVCFIMHTRTLHHNESPYDIVNTFDKRLPAYKALLMMGLENYTKFLDT